MTYDETHLRAHAEQVLDEALTGRRERYPGVPVRKRPVVGPARHALIGGPVRQGERHRRNGVASRA
ncbi:hypothetical protein PV963_01730 [Streptomyces coeruleorubidus]|uniref:hypothetical protein n=1 Tax=Streptomyces coeruleorubidus TaxID=116188 RepID=UPI00237F5540|nr:hypothetical protein [Streptomyces coeruleorubidus]WDV49254.1 hypothetical protein PV963_01730 [Streptomyces coeruleorubidus]